MADAKPHILVDVSYLAYRGLHSVGKSGLSFGGDPTGVVWSYLDQLLGLCLSPRIRSNYAHSFFDSKHSFRKLEYPSYKDRNKGMTEAELAERSAMHQQVDLLRRELLPDCGFPTYVQRGVESDDLIASACQYALEGNATRVIVTADNDLLQCIREGVDWFDPARDKYYGTSDLYHEKGISGDDWAEVKCLMGCRGDCVKGIPGVGERTAIDHLWKLLPKTSKKRQAIESEKGRRIARRNRKLVVLPHRRTRDVDLKFPDYRPKAFFKWCERLRFDSFLSEPRRRQWDAFFAGEMRGRQGRGRRSACGRGPKHDPTQRRGGPALAGSASPKR